MSLLLDHVRRQLGFARARAASYKRMGWHDRRVKWLGEVRATSTLLRILNEMNHGTTARP